MAEVTIKLIDNPLAGQRGQADYTMVISSDPDIPYEPGEELPDPETLTVAQIAAIECLVHIADISYEMAFVQLARASEN